MASVGEASKQDQRIACSSRHNLKILTDAINKQIENVIDKNVTWTDEQKEQYKQRIREIYESAFHENVTIDGQGWSETDSEDVTTEMEPVNLERKKYVNTQLDELDSQIKITAKKRKHYPRLCKEHLHRKYKYENACLSKLEMNVGSSIGDTETRQLATDLLPEAQIQLKTACEKLGQLMKTIPSTLNKAERLQNVLGSSQHIKDSKTDSVIFKPLSDEDKMAESITPLKTRLKKTPTSPKKCKSDSVPRRRSGRLLEMSQRGYVAKQAKSK